MSIQSRKQKRVFSRMERFFSIHGLILLSFTLLSVFLILLLSVTLYQQFNIRSQRNMESNTEQILRQTRNHLEDDLLSIREVSDAMYYAVIKNTDFSREDISREMNLMVESHRDQLVSIALFDRDGRLMTASPLMEKKRNVLVNQESWFIRAERQVENLHFSNAHVQNLFRDSSLRYHWVISLSRAVELNTDGETRSGVLLVDMNYAAIAELLSHLNGSDSTQYYYLCDKEGHLIYHPKQLLISNGLYQENVGSISSLSDGVNVETFQGKKRTVIIDTVGYTGWRLVSVIPMSSHYFAMSKTGYLVLMLVSVTILLMLLMNQLISSWITYPLKRLNDSVEGLEAGRLPWESIYTGGTQEVSHLGRSLRQSVQQIEALNEEHLREQEEKRKTELDALQSQINPHFLYNTLDAVVWMIEGDHKEDAVFMVTELASFFRISLSRGKNIISIGQECRHAENYMNIQHARFKNRFRIDFSVPEEVKHCLTVKLVLQPILENAIYYGMEGLDEDEGIITVSASVQEHSLSLIVRDNGIGMPQEQLKRLLTDHPMERKIGKHRGSGVGLRNVDCRIRLRFGADFGLYIESEPDVGTKVEIRLPRIPDTEENRERLEKGELPET